jgi:hypothetical protein
MTLMTNGLYNEPMGAYLPSILYCFEKIHCVAVFQALQKTSEEIIMLVRSSDR